MVEKILPETDLRVIFIEDSLYDFEIIRNLLLNAGYNLIIDRVDSEQDFITALRRNKYDIILADFKIPGYDGFAALNKAVEICPDIPFIVVSGTIGEETAIDLIKQGAVDYILKDRPARLPSAIKIAIEQFKKKKALQENEALLSTLFEVSPVGLLLIESETGVIFRINTAAAKIIGLKESQIKGRSCGEVSYAADLNQPLSGSVYKKEITLSGKDGKEIPVYKSVIGLKWNNRDYQLESIIDITDRKKAEAERERLLAAIEQSSESVVITDPDGNIEYTNKAFTDMTGYSAEEIIGENPRILKSGRQDETFYRRLWEDLSGGNTFRGKMINRSKDGSLYTEEATISPVRDDAGRIVNYVAVKRNITEHIKLEEQLRQAQKMESIGRLAGGVAHDFNNILTVILNYAQLSMEKLGTSDPLYENLKEINDAAERSADIVQQLLAFARRQTISPRVIEANKTIENMLKMLKNMIGDEIELVWRPAPYICQITADPAQISQILTNLCINAKEAINGLGRITIETKNATFNEEYISLHTGFKTGEFVLISVSDNGPGIDKSLLDNIFEPFYTTKNSSKNTGLGLATVYGIVKQNKGFVSVYSEPGAGATFKIYLPHSTDSLEGFKPEENKRAQKPNGETILVVDDDTAVLSLLKRVLINFGYKVLTSSKPEEAIDIAGKHKGIINLLLTDVFMPEMNGRDMAGIILKSHPSARVLFMSGYSSETIEQKGILDKNVNFIQKPFKTKNMAAMIQELIGSQKQQSSD